MQVKESIYGGRADNIYGVTFSNSGGVARVPLVLRYTSSPCSLGQWVEDVDRVTHVEAFPEPAGTSRPRMDAQAQCLVLHAEDFHGIAGHFCSRRHLGQRPPVRPAELERSVGPAHDLKTLLVHRAMMPATEHREVGQRRRAPMRPVADMMALAEADAAARKPAALVPMMERPP